MRRRFWLGLSVFSVVLLMVTGLGASSVAAQSEVQIIEQRVESIFRSRMVAYLEVVHDVEITEVRFFYRSSEDAVIIKDVLDIRPNQKIEVTYNLNRLTMFLPPGAVVEYWWQLVDARGDVHKTETQTYLYLDDRFEFKSLQDDRITLYWYRGSPAFGTALFQKAVEALDRLETDVGATIAHPIKIFIYGSHRDLLSAIFVGAREWTGGVAYSEHGVIVIGIEPRRLQWGLEAMIHELTHLVIHQATDNPYGGLPLWLNEGIAVYNENPDGLAEEYQSVIEEALADDALLTLRSLAGGFPADPGKAQLAYGQSGAVVHFIIDTYGTDAMAQLLKIFAEGAVPDKALQATLGKDTWGLDNDFRISLGAPPLPDFPPGSSPLIQQPDQPGNLETGIDQTSLQETRPDDGKGKTNETLEREETSPSPIRQVTSSAADSVRRSICLSGLLPLITLGTLVVYRRQSRQNADFANDQ